MYYLGLCAIIKDETPFLEEWVAYHMHLGVEAFYLYDNGSRTPVRETLRPFERFHTRESLRIHNAPGERIQMITYGHCLAAYAGKCRWIAFMDLDEFVVPKRHESIPGMLEEFEPYAGLALNWQVFGSNGHLTRPEGLQIENYTRALAPDLPVHRHVKSIVKPDRASFFPNPHLCGLNQPGDAVVTENHEPLFRPRTDTPSREKGQVNHYYYRSKKDFYAKLRKPRADYSGMRKAAGNLILSGDYEDRSACRFAPGVNNILAAVRRPREDSP
ncbi:MAG: glycosyltransferase family 92 protein [Deltaproteobacteria bacterium]|nr:glycosyltransferase family 92 protein [Deltaproteobacteria bacterium]